MLQCAGEGVTRKGRGCYASTKPDPRATIKDMTAIPRALRAVAIVAGFLAAAACGQEPRDNARFLGPCADPTAALAAPAIDPYIRSVLPRPRRFLVASGTDSALPGAAEAQLQRFGPTYMFPPDPALRERQLARLDSIAKDYGDMPTLLVTYRGVNRAGENRAIVRLGGFFLTGAPTGNVAHRAVQFVCDTARWHVLRAEEERQS